jgi:hypothetical protein
MQWWMRPGPRRPCAISKPRPSPSSRFAAGASVVEIELGVPVRRVVVAEHPQHAHRRTPGVVDRNEDHRLLTVAVDSRIGLAHE